MVNVDRITALQKLIEKDQRVCMESWQTAPSGWQAGGNLLAFDLETFHHCENKACIGGYMTLMPEYKAAGGFIDRSTGSPRAYGASGSEAVAAFLGIPSEHAEVLVTGSFGYEENEKFVCVRNWRHWDWHHAVEALEITKTCDQMPLGEYIEKLSGVYLDE